MEYLTTVKIAKRRVLAYVPIAIPSQNSERYFCYFDPRSLRPCKLVNKLAV